VQDENQLLKHKLATLEDMYRNANEQITRERANNKKTVGELQERGVQEGRAAEEVARAVVKIREEIVKLDRAGLDIGIDLDDLSSA
jgi:hypothetical protein